MENGWLVSSSAITAPPSDSGSADKMVMGWNTRTNNRTSTASTMSTPAAIASTKFCNNSPMNSVSPFLTRCTPCGRCVSAGNA